MLEVHEDGRSAAVRSSSSDCSNSTGIGAVTEATLVVPSPVPDGTQRP